MFIGDGSTTWAPPSDVVLGDLSVLCWTGTCAGGNIVSGSTFMLTINQTGPNWGSASISGLLGWDASTNTLSWTPNLSSVTIGGTTYALNEDGTGCAYGSPCIDINTPQDGAVAAYTGIHDDLTGQQSITSTPEPATLGLMATGLIGLVPVVRRRRRE